MIIIRNQKRAIALWIAMAVACLPQVLLGQEVVLPKTHKWELGLRRIDLSRPFQLNPIPHTRNETGLVRGGEIYLQYHLPNGHFLRLAIGGAYFKLGEPLPDPLTAAPGTGLNFTRYHAFDAEAAYGVQLPQFHAPGLNRLRFQVGTGLGFQALGRYEFESLYVNDQGNVRHEHTTMTGGSYWSGFVMLQAGFRVVANVHVGLEYQAGTLLRLGVDHSRLVQFTSDDNGDTEAHFELHTTRAQFSLGQNMASPILFISTKF